jgi:putative heme-binding domain-containing protein
MKPKSTSVCIGLLALMLAAPALAQTRPSNDAAAGRRIFDAQCAWCHGADGTGGMGPSLQGTLRHGSTTASIVEIITNGIAGTDMPGFSAPLTSRSIRQTAAYVRTLSLAASRTAPGLSTPLASGSAKRGAAIYQSSGCASCHVVGGSGGTLGPELTSIGGSRGGAYLREAIVKPAAAHPPGYLVVRAVPANGPEVRGIRVSEDVFWVLIRDASGAIHTLQKSELKSLDREIDASLMPSYATRLNDSQLDDLVAYLTTLRGAK